MTMSMLVLIVLVLLLISVLPTWPYSQSWGYGPTGLLGTVVLVVLVLYLAGYL